jgi:hypothetical protein
MGGFASPSPLPSIPSPASRFPSARRGVPGGHRGCAFRTRPRGRAARFPLPGRLWPHPPPGSGARLDALSCGARLCRRASVSCLTGRRRAGRGRAAVPADGRSPAPPPGGFGRPAECAPARGCEPRQHGTPIGAAGAGGGARLAPRTGQRDRSGWGPVGRFGGRPGGRSAPRRRGRPGQGRCGPGLGGLPLGPERQRRASGTGNRRPHQAAHAR